MSKKVLLLLATALLCEVCFASKRTHKVKDLTPKRGKCSWFVNNHRAAINPSLTRRYVAMRWDYDALADEYGIPRGRIKTWLRENVLVIVHANGKSVGALIADWGPNARTERIIDVSRDILKDLGAHTDDTLVCTFEVRR